MHAAANLGLVAAIKRLHEQKADVNTLDKVLVLSNALSSLVQAGNTPLHFAVTASSLESIAILLQLKADPQLKNKVFTFHRCFNMRSVL